AATCGGECPVGLTCKTAVRRDPSSPAICVPPTVSLCRPCSGDEDCGAWGDLCLPIGQDAATFCALDCSETQLCPEGFACSEVHDADGELLARQCLPEANTCTCNDLTAGAKRFCQRT